MGQFNSTTFGRHASRWLMITALIELGVAAVFVVLAFTVPAARIAMIVTAVILGVVGLGLFEAARRAGARAAQNQRVLTGGTMGQATITGLTQTGMYMNEQPQLQLEMMVQVPGRAPYPVSLKQFVPLIALGRVTSGAPLAVKVDPSNEANVVIDWESSGMIGSPLGGFPIAGMQMGGFPVAAAPSAPGATASPGAPIPGSTPGSAQDESLAQVQQALQASGLQAPQAYAQAHQGQYTLEQLRAHLRANGLSGTATILQLQDSGKVVGDERMFTMQCRVEVQGRPAYVAPSSAAMVPVAAAGKVKLGATVPIKVAAENPQLLMFEWDKI